MIERRLLPSLDLNFLGTALVIAAIGCMLIYSATYFGDPSLNIFRKQLLWMTIALVLMAIFIVVDYHVLFDIAPILYGIGLALLTYLLIWGKLRAHTKSWIQLPGGFQFQPSEFMKIFTALMLAKFFDSNDRAYLNLRSFAMAMAIIGAPVLLILAQPDFGTAATFAPLVAVAMFFGGIRWRFWVILSLVVIIALPLGWKFFLKGYQKERIMIFLNPERDPLGSGYQVTQAKIAIGSGGIHGKGFRQGTQAKLEYLPARHTDFIFAVLGEEWGFIGVVIVLGLYLFLIVQSLSFAKHARDRGGTFLIIALICFFIFHILINVSMQIGVLPTTGIPLPLISYGGSSTMMFFIAIGLMLNVDMRRFVNV
jgi:rod shape determining protein RodA